jgi:hypothetical protein
MRNAMFLQESELKILEQLIGKRLKAYGSVKPGIDPGYLVEDVFVEFEDSLISIREEYIRTEVCGEMGEYLSLRVEEGYHNRNEAGAAGGVFYFYKGEPLHAVKVHRARLNGEQGTNVQSFEHDALLEFKFESGSLWILKDELSTPFIRCIISKEGEALSLPSPADGWPHTLTDNWTGEWIS